MENFIRELCEQDGSPVLKMEVAENFRGKNRYTQKNTMANKSVLRAFAVYGENSASRWLHVAYNEATRHYTNAMFVNKESSYCVYELYPELTSRIHKSIGEEWVGRAIVAFCLNAIGTNRIVFAENIFDDYHPLVAVDLLGLWYCKPDSTSQLIFTTHHTSLLDEHGILRDDQVGFTENRKLYYLNDFEKTKYERPTKSRQAKYLLGRYGATPVADFGIYDLLKWR